LYVVCSAKSPKKTILRLAAAEATTVKPTISMLIFIFLGYFLNTRSKLTRSLKWFFKSIKVSKMDTSSQISLTTKSKQKGIFHSKIYPIYHHSQNLLLHISWIPISSPFPLYIFLFFSVILILLAHLIFSYPFLRLDLITDGVNLALYIKDPADKVTTARQQEAIDYYRKTVRNYR